MVQTKKRLKLLYGFSFYFLTFIYSFLCQECESILSKDENNRTYQEKQYIYSILRQTNLFRQLQKEVDFQIQSESKKQTTGTLRSSLFDIDELLQKTERSLKYIKIPQDSFLFHQGDEPTQIYFILNGYAGIYTERDKADIQKDLVEAKRLSKQLLLMHRRLQYFQNLLIEQEPLFKNSLNSFSLNLIQPSSNIESCEMPFSSTSIEMCMQEQQQSIVLIPQQIQSNENNQQQVNEKQQSDLSGIKKKMKECELDILNLEDQINNILTKDQQQLFIACQNYPQYQSKYFTSKGVANVCNYQKITSLGSMSHLGEASNISKEKRTASVVACDPLDSSPNFQDIHSCFIQLPRRKKRQYDIPCLQDGLELMSINTDIYSSIFEEAFSLINYPLSILRKFLKETKSHSLIKISYFFNLREYTYGKNIFTEGVDSSDFIFLIRRGSINLSKFQKQEKQPIDNTKLTSVIINKVKIKPKLKEINLGVVGEGQFFGVENNYPTQQKRSFSAKALTNCLIYALPISVFEDSQVPEELKIFLIGQNKLKESYHAQAEAKAKVIEKIMECELEQIYKQPKMDAVITEVESNIKKKFLNNSKKISSILNGNINQSVQQKDELKKENEIQLFVENELFNDKKSKIIAQNKQALKLKPVNELFIQPDTRDKILQFLNAKKTYSKSKDSSNSYIRQIQDPPICFTFSSSSNQQVNATLIQPKSISGDQTQTQDQNKKDFVFRLQKIPQNGSIRHYSHENKFEIFQSKQINNNSLLLSSILANEENEKKNIFHKKRDENSQIQFYAESSQKYIKQTPQVMVRDKYVSSQASKRYQFIQSQQQDSQSFRSPRISQSSNQSLLQSCKQIVSPSYDQSINSQKSLTIIAKNGKEFEASNIENQILKGDQEFQSEIKEASKMELKNLIPILKREEMVPQNEELFNNPCFIKVIPTYNKQEEISKTGEKSESFKRKVSRSKSNSYYNYYENNQLKYQQQEQTNYLKYKQLTNLSTMTQRNSSKEAEEKIRNESLLRNLSLPQSLSSSHQDLVVSQFLSTFCQNSCPTTPSPQKQIGSSNLQQFNHMKAFSFQDSELLLHSGINSKSSQPSTFQRKSQSVTPEQRNNKMLTFFTSNNNSHNHNNYQSFKYQEPLSKEEIHRVDFEKYKRNVSQKQGRFMNKIFREESPTIQSKITSQTLNIQTQKNLFAIEQGKLRPLVTPIVEEELSSIKYHPYQSRRIFPSFHRQ